MGTDKIKDIFENIDQEEVVVLTEKLIEIESHKESVQRESAVAYYIQSFFRSHDIEAWTEEIYPNRPNIYAKVGKSDKSYKRIILNGHIDTVPAYTMENAFQPKRKENDLYGRGAVDMKGAIAAMMVAMVTLKRYYPNLAGEVIFAGVIDEEERAEGARHIADSGNLTADIAIIGEPTELKIMPAHKGMEWTEVAFHGKSSHGSTPNAGINAVYHASEFIRIMQENLLPELERREHPVLGKPTLNLGKIIGGSDPNVVPDKCFLQFDRRWLPGESTESMIEEFNNLVRIQKKTNPSIEVSVRRMSETTGYHPPLDTPFDHWGVKALEKGVRTLFGRDPEVVMFPGWSDGAQLANGGIPSVVCGPGRLEDAHSGKEKINMNELYQAAVLYTYFALDITGRGKNESGK
ncbi:acetylornithine deacetylase/succinyl-diaminopimelate desuccinylase [Lentibacillus persicus]|uniref:Acetylornithine deacetylase/succinyl-diaminopimelate desuccinylase n=1 Tax=Lentibacillus persicus TaxID=640948 RepID=A0A1I1W3G8_9BACI|nr:M20 family metallopeptidase [Lentibacillus persicus]SFD87510.1 acetylornithine deacetylase/succinyl-diaminopimelate desuccinylase [Lentibacillus persicus]